MFLNRCGTLECFAQHFCFKGFCNHMSLTSWVWRPRENFFLFLYYYIFYIIIFFVLISLLWPQQDFDLQSYKMFLYSLLFFHVWHLFHVHIHFAEQIQLRKHNAGSGWHDLDQELVAAQGWPGTEWMFPMAEGCIRAQVCLSVFRDSSSVPRCHHLHLQL